MEVAVCVRLVISCGNTCSCFCFFIMLKLIALQPKYTRLQNICLNRDICHFLGQYLEHPHNHYTFYTATCVTAKKHHFVDKNKLHSYRKDEKTTKIKSNTSANGNCMALVFSIRDYGECVKWMLVANTQNTL